MENTVIRAIQSVDSSIIAYCKFLSANDSGETGGHQAGILISKKAKSMLFDDKQELIGIVKRKALINWMDDLTTESVFTYYQSKNEFRITSFGRGFPYINPEDTGALFVFTKQDNDNYSGYFLYTEEDINSFLDNYGLSPTDTNNIINQGIFTNGSMIEFKSIMSFIDSITIDYQVIFPDSITMSKKAREIEELVYNHSDYKITNPDKKIIDWTAQEYRLFKAIEEASYYNTISRGFDNVETFVEFANQVLNRRKSRAGKSLEHHISAIFDANRIEYEEQVRTEGNKRPDFIFPSGCAYHDLSFPVDRLISLAAKTTCKDRWRQVINEADRLRDRNKYLLTLQQGISTPQLMEMEEERVILVVPRPYIASYPRDQQSKIWSIKKFVDYVKEAEGLS